MRFRLNSKIVSNGVGQQSCLYSSSTWVTKLQSIGPENVKIFTESDDEYENSPRRAVDRNLSQHVAVE